VKSWLKIPVLAAKAWNADDILKHSAAVSFYTLFSLAPMLIIVVAVIGVFFGKEEASRQLQEQVTQLVGPASAEVVSAATKASDTEKQSVVATVFGVVLLMVGATTVFGQLQKSLNEIWGVEAKPDQSNWLLLIIRRLVSFAMVVTIGFLLLVSLVVSTALQTLLGSFHSKTLASPAFLQGVNVVVGLVVITSLFALLFKVLPDVKLRWRDVWIGAFLTSLLFSVGRMLIAIYLGHSTVASVYGAAGSLVALLIWVYYSSAILFYGVEFTRAYRLHQGLEVEPKPSAVLVAARESPAPKKRPSRKRVSP
jgi:membrane protein